MPHELVEHLYETVLLKKRYIISGRYHAELRMPPADKSLRRLQMWLIICYIILRLKEDLKLLPCYPFMYVMYKPLRIKDLMLKFIVKVSYGLIKLPS